MSEDIALGRYMRAVQRETPVGRKTASYDVLSVSSGEALGTVQWFGRWRQYTFDPSPNSTFNRDCMIDLANFLRRLNDDQRRTQGERKP